MAEATLSSKNQIVIPREAREALGVRAGDRLLVVVRGNTVVILPRPRSWSRALRGLAKERYPEGYLNRERASWD
jgi:AbrB family looped-hinge helix DNA binding protein